MFGLLVVARRLARALRRGWSDPSFRGVVWIAVTLVMAGGFFYARVEGWTFFQGIYFSVITLGTVGYGDLAPVTFAGRLFTIFYVLVGVGVIVALAGQLASQLIEGRAERKGRATGT
jgi:hypothetical protein